MQQDTKPPAIEPDAEKDRAAGQLATSLGPGGRQQMARAWHDLVDLFGEAKAHEIDARPTTRNDVFTVFAMISWKREEKERGRLLTDEEKMAHGAKVRMDHPLYWRDDDPELRRQVGDYFKARRPRKG